MKKKVDNHQLEKILAGCTIPGITNKTYEDTRLYNNIGFVKYLHKCLIKPIAKKGSTDILRRELLKSIGPLKGKTVIDVSVGDDLTILKIADKAKYVYANDISVHAMVPVIKASSHNNIIFSNKNFFDLELEKADIVLCKNTLHHMNTIDQIKNALLKLKKLGKKIIIMDVEDPKLTTRARLWNAYYVFMLKDQGGFFINYDQFNKVLKAVYKHKKIDTKKVNTIKGHYMLAVVK